MIEHSKKATILILVIIFAILIALPIVMYNTRFEVDEKSVWFSREGIPHCPYCFKIVEPFTGYCVNCESHFRWIDKQVVCWNCGGQKTCPVCKGSRYYPNWFIKGEEQCYNCFGTGECQFCLPDSNAQPKLKGDQLELRPSKLERKLQGFNVYGSSVIRYPEQRP